jgi:hypothetical protein
MLSNVLNSIGAIATCYTVVEVSVLKGSTFVATRCISVMILMVVIRKKPIIRGGFGFFLILLFGLNEMRLVAGMTMERFERLRCRKLWSGPGG